MTEFAFIATKRKAREQLQRAVFGRGKALGVLCCVVLCCVLSCPTCESTAAGNRPQKYAGCEKSCIAGMVFKRFSEELSSAVRGVDNFNTSVTWRNSATFVTC
jgi:hypothetical protein